MKRILIITYYWPPSGGSGVQRWLKFAKYLPEFGWQPVVYTPQNPDFDIKDEGLLADIPKEAEIIKTKIWEPYQLYRTLTGNKGSEANFGMTGEKSKKNLMGRFSLWVRGNVFVPDPRVFWRRPSIRFLKKYIAENHVDAVVTTGPPHSMHLIGLGLKKAFPKLVWLADMRDPWSTFDIHNAFLSPSAKAKNASLEKAVLEHADRVIMVSPSMQEEFQNFDNQKLVLITNGFDTEDFRGQALHSEKSKNKFCIKHSGLFNFIRNPENLWRALEELCAENAAFAEKLSLELTGNVDPLVRESIAAFPVLKTKASYRGWVSHEEVIAENAKADLFLLIVNNSRNAKAQLPGKLFEYLALQKPILAICPENADVAKIIAETGAGASCPFEDKNRIKNALMKIFEKWQNDKSCDFKKEKIDAFSRKKLTEKLVGVLENLIFDSPEITKK